LNFVDLAQYTSWTKDSISKSNPLRPINNNGKEAAYRNFITDHWCHKFSTTAVTNKILVPANGDFHTAYTNNYDAAKVSLLDCSDTGSADLFALLKQGGAFPSDLNKHCDTLTATCLKTLKSSAPTGLKSWRHVR